MSKATFTFEDKGGELAVSIDYGDEGLNKSSPAHKMTAIMTEWMKTLDSMPTEAPKLVYAAEDIGAKKAEQIAHLGSKPQVIHAPWALGE
jgi:hypothetical protein